jgi:hypothetical protein
MPSKKLSVRLRATLAILTMTVLVTTAYATTEGVNRNLNGLTDIRNEMVHPIRLIAPLRR